jgi:uncharacterized membrane protein YccC
MRALACLLSLWAWPLFAQDAADTELAKTLAQCSAQVSKFCEFGVQQKQLNAEAAHRLDATAAVYLQASAALSSDEEAKRSVGEASYREIVTMRLSTRSGETPVYLNFLSGRVQNCKELFAKNESYLAPRIEAFLQRQPKLRSN